MESSPITAKDSIPPWERDRSIVRPARLHESPVKNPGRHRNTNRKETKASKKARKAKRLAERLEELSRMSYWDYLASPEWKAKRKKVIRRAKGKC